MMDDENISKFLFDTWIEDEIRNCEDRILKLMKAKQEKYPSEYNDKLWLDFSNFTCLRRFNAQVFMPISEDCNQAFINKLNDYENDLILVKLPKVLGTDKDYFGVGRKGKHGFTFSLITPEIIKTLPSRHIPRPEWENKESFDYLEVIGTIEKLP